MLQPIVVADAAYAGATEAQYVRLLHFGFCFLSQRRKLSLRLLICTDKKSVKTARLYVQTFTTVLSW